jgi:hypothetical protein
MNLANAWYFNFLQTLQQHEASKPLKDAATAGRLGDWTQALTGTVVDVCQQMGWQTAAKWHPADLLPVTRSEYLALDAVAFDVRDESTLPPWPFPVAAFELENSRDDDKVAYSLWKLLCVRTHLRVLFCYRRSAGEGGRLVTYLGKAVVGSLPIEERTKLVGITLIVVGSRAEESTFPYGFFKDWILDKNAGRFDRP